MFVNHEKNGGNLLYTDFYGNVRLSSDAIANSKDIFGRTEFNANNQQYLSTYSGKNENLIDAFLKSKNENLSYNTKIICKNSPSNKIDIDNLKLYARKELENNNSLGLGIYSSDENIVMHNLSGGENTSTTSWREANNGRDSGHAVFVTDIADDGFIVSSWGEKYLITFDDLSTGVFVLNSASITKN
jgi:hypothetical protein